MKNPEIVKQAIAALRDNAESDFEHHRIDVLERDLTQGPPPVEIIDDTHQRFNGLTYNEDVTGHYRVNAQIHRDVYEYHNGKIPDGHVIHHIDGNPANNDIANLMALTPSAHMVLHGKIGKNAIKGRRTNKTQKKPLSFCEYCGMEFTPKRKDQRFCSRHCAGLSRNNTDSLQIQRKCEFCGSRFIPKRKDQRFCSRDCSLAVTHQKQKMSATKKSKKCEYCNKPFSPLHHYSRFCSRECYHNSHNQPRKCEYCGKDFRHLDSKQRFCSRSCAAKACRNKSR